MPPQSLVWRGLSPWLADGCLFSVPGEAEQELSGASYQTDIDSCEGPTLMTSSKPEASSANATTLEIRASTSEFQECNSVHSNMI